ncbi:MAG: phosphate propanoyltransferase [Oscillospiraceae bacterium]
MENLHVMIEGSGRHVHVSRADLDVLYGVGFELEQKKALSQPGQFASPQKVDIVGPKGTLKGVSILGPCRPQSQVELSFTDARTIGFTPQIRESGKLGGTDGCTLVGPNGSVELKEGVIVALRHVHLCPDTAEKYGIKNGDIVQLQTGDGTRKLIFDEVLARVSENCADAVHLDYDEVNAGALFGDQTGVILKK